MTHSSHRRITVGEIANLAGVGASAVSNWRRRYRDFPAPVEAMPGGDLFDFSSVMAWLEIHGRAANLALPSLDRDLWTVADSLRNALRIEDAVLVTLQTLYVHWRAHQDDVAHKYWTAIANTQPGTIREQWVHAAQKMAQDVPDLRQVLSLPRGLSDYDLWRVTQDIEAIGFHAPSEGWGALVTAFLRHTQQALSKTTGDWVTPASITQLMVQLLSPIVNVVYDPAAGFAMFLAEAAQQNKTVPIHLVGQELLDASWRIGYLHLAFQNVDFQLAWGDTLQADQFPDMRATRVGLDTPLGVRFRSDDSVFFDPRWRFGAATTAEWMWAQHLISHLAEDGIGVMTMPAGALSRVGRDAAIRKAITAAGFLDAVIELPPGLTPGTAIAVALLIFDCNRANRRNRVLFIDARQLGIARRGKVNELPPDGLDRIAATVSAWRTGTFGDEPLFAGAASIDEILRQAGDISPKRYVRYTSLIDGTTDEKSIERVGSTLLAAKAALESVGSVKQRITESLDAFAPSARLNWPLVKIGTLLVQPPQTGTRQEMEGRGPSLPWVPTRLVSSGAARLTALPEERTRSPIKGRLAKRGDLLLASRGINAESHIGCATVDFDGEAAFAESLMLLTPETDLVLPDYLRIALTSASGRMALAAATTGSVIANLRRDALEEVEIRLPDVPTQERIIAGLRGIEQGVTQLDFVLEASRIAVDMLYDEIAAGLYGPAH